MIFVVNWISIANCLHVLPLLATVCKTELYDFTSQTCNKAENIIFTPFKEGKLPKCVTCYVRTDVKLVGLSLASDS